MSPNEAANIQSMKELDWLAQFFVMHGRQDLAEKIGQDVEQMRNRMKGKEQHPLKSLNNIKPDSSDLAGPG